MACMMFKDLVAIKPYYVVPKKYGIIPQNSTTEIRNRGNFLYIYYMRLVDNNGEFFAAFELKQEKRHQYPSRSRGMQKWPIANRFYNREMKPVLEHVFDKELQDYIKYC